MKIKLEIIQKLPSLDQKEVFDKIKAYKGLKIKEVVLDFISPSSEEILQTMEIIGNELIPEL